jgi:hypothetical protein
MLASTIRMDGNYTIMVNFETIPPVQYTLTVSTTAGGNVTEPGVGNSPMLLARWSA